MASLLLPVIALALCGFAAAASHHKLCYPEYPELDGALCYKKCRSGYDGVGPVCWSTPCPSETTNIGAVCTKKTYGRGVGKPLHTCPSNTDKNGLLCYPKCKSGYYGAGPVCWENCKSGYTDDGALCRRNAHIYGRDTGSCPWHDKCGLCGGPWYNVCGKRRNCGGSCRSGYHNDGCTCRRDVHIYAKKSYGRGVGSPMGCSSSEELNGALCYPKCKSGYYGVGPVCWGKCNSATTDTGTQCQKKTYGRGVGEVINCLKPPGCSIIENNCNTVKSIFDGVKGVQKLQTAACTALYWSLEKYLIMLQTISSCFVNEDWKTVSMSVSVSAAAGASVVAEVGIAVDMNTDKGICFVVGCTGFKADLSIGVDLNIAIWKSLDSIPGESTAVALGLDIPGTEFGVGATMVMAHPSGEYIGTVFSLGGGIGLNPIDVGVYRCSTPQSAVTDLTKSR